MNDKPIFSSLLNPFTRLAGAKALLAGLLFFIITTIAGSYGGVVFDGVINVHLLRSTISEAFLIHGLSLVMLIIFMYLAGLIFSKSSIRLIDVAGTMTLARAPFLLSALFLLLPGTGKYLNEFISGLLMMSFSQLSFQAMLVGIISFLIFFISIVWFIILAYNGFTVSCNIKGSKNILVFICALLISFIVSFGITLKIFTTKYMAIMPENIVVVDDSAENEEFVGINKIALNCAKSILDRQYDDAVSDFDPVMKNALPADQLKKVIGEVESKFGNMKEVEDKVSNLKTQGNRLVLVPVRFEKQVINFRFTFNEDDKIIGFFM